jgi:pyrroloquinoline quinone biosynthesis protein B
MSLSERAVKVTLLGIAQDGGRPQPGCFRSCCAAAYDDPSLVRHPVSLGLVGADHSTHLFEASRDLAWQFGCWSRHDPAESPLSSLWITHAHQGHVDGLGLFGAEAIAAKGLPLHCSASFARLLTKNASWAQMMREGVLAPRPFLKGKPIMPYADSGFSITPIKVPHRAELSDMHAFLISGPKANLLFLPDHDYWQETLAAVGCDEIRDWLGELEVDIALLDGTFWSSDELSLRQQEEVPHPTVEETMGLLGSRRDGDPRVIFIHLNHTNPLHDSESEAAKAVVSMGWEIGVEGMVFDLSSTPQSS